jgi:hypothetical protein
MLEQHQSQSPSFEADQKQSRSRELQRPESSWPLQILQKSRIRLASLQRDLLMVELWLNFTRMRRDIDLKRVEAENVLLVAAPKPPNPVDGAAF